MYWRTEMNAYSENRDECYKKRCAPTTAAAVYRVAQSIYAATYTHSSTDNLGIHHNCMKTRKGIIARSTREGHEGCGRGRDGMAMQYHAIRNRDRLRLQLARARAGCNGAARGGGEGVLYIHRITGLTRNDPRHQVRDNTSA